MPALCSFEKDVTINQPDYGKEGGTMFWHRKTKKTPAKSFDRREKQPVIRASICTGEKTACFRNLKTGRLEEVMLLRDEQDRQEFLDAYGIREEELETIY